MAATEVEGTHQICNGSQGPQGDIGLQGEQGIQGAAGKNTLVAFLDEEAGSNCSTGGTRIDYGKDLNDDDTLQETEIEGTRYVCTGAQGPQGVQGIQGEQGIQGVAGVDGVNTLLELQSESAGANCATGGTRIDYGKDLNDDDTLQETEIEGTRYVCTGAQGPQGTQGIQGAPGEQGPIGPAAQIPSGMIVFFAGACPSGFTEYTALRGRTLMGSASANAGESVGNALNSGGIRSITQVPSHVHVVDPPASSSADAGSHKHSVDPPSTSSDSTGAHQHSVDPPNTSTNSTGNHSHNVDPPNTGTSSAGNHNHNFRTAHHDTDSSSSQGYPAGNNHNSMRTTDRVQREENRGTIRDAGNHSHSVDISNFNSGSAGSHSHSVDIGSFNSGSAGNHSHTTNIAAFDSSAAGNHQHSVDIAAFSSASTGESSVDVTMPYLQLTACIAN